MPLVRKEQREKLRRGTYDVVIIGGGATGGGLAVEAASRGLKVALIERGDFSCGTSSRSTKLVHGGVRYLEQAILKFDRSQFNLVRDALHERATLFKIAPHLVRLLPIFTPVYKSLEIPYYLTGLKLYDRLAGSHNLKSSYFVRSKSAVKRFPLLKAKGLRGGVIYYDGQFDDARLNVTLALTAAELGATVVNYIEVVGFEKGHGKIEKVRVKDAFDGEEWSLACRSVINATGPYVDSIRNFDEPKAPPMLNQSSGVHLILDKSYTPPDMGLLIPKTEDGRVLFVLPWLGRALVGTTDNPARLEVNPKAGADEVTYILRQLEQYYSKVPRSKDILAKWSGLRPLVANLKASDTARLSRDHIVHVSDSGLVTVAGGKWTTYRKMAQDGINQVIETAGLKPARKSHTETLKLVGAEGYSDELLKELQKKFDLPETVATHLARSYGDRAPRIAALAAKGYGKRLCSRFPYLEAEVLHGVLEEGAATAIDVLARRTRLSFLDSKATTEALPRVIELMGEALGWDKERRQAEYRQARDYIA